MPTAKELRARIVKMRIINSKHSRRDSLLSLSRLLNSWAVNPNLLIHSTISLIPVFSTSYLNFPRCVARATIADRIPGKPNSDILEAISPALILLGSYVTSALAAIKATNMLFTPYSFLQCFSIAATQEPQNEIRLRSLSVVRFFHICVEAQLLLMFTFFILGFLDRAPIEEDIYDSYRKCRFQILVSMNAESRTPSLFYLQMSTHRLIRRGSGESHFLDRLRQYLWCSLVGLILNIAGFLLQNHPEVNDIGPFADYPFDVRHATLAGHALNVNFNRVGLLHELPCFRHARYAYQVRCTLVIGVVEAIPVKFNNKFRIVQRVKDNGKTLTSNYRPTISDTLTPIILFVNMLLLIAVCKIFCILVLLPILLIKWRKFYSKKREERQQTGTVVGIFHPYCNAGGGGERVLWAAVHAIQTKYPDIHIAIYTGDLDADPEKILSQTEKTFNMKLQPNIEFVYLHGRKWVEASTYPYFTLLGQSLGSVYLGIEALNNLTPDIYIDTMGYAFTYPLFKYIGGCLVGSYTHYPTISTDMLKYVYKRVVAYNNRRIIARNPLLSGGKFLYYKLFAYLYGLVGSCADIVIVNSSWTEEHINTIWKCPLKTHRVYPPCSVEHLIGVPLLSDEEKNKCIRIIAIAQFRPEKNHPLMLRAMFELRSILKEEVWEKVKLVCIGSCRDAEDERRVKDMQDLAKHLALDKNVEFKLNVPYSELVSEMQKGTIGLHTMWNEHFGIGIVECMAAGLIMVAHSSGGPRADIIETRMGSVNGFLAEDEMEYAKVIASVVQMPPKVRNAIRIAARSSVNRFSCEVFEKEFLRAIEPFFRSKQE
ncbi:Asparagine-linked glycosylation protein 11 like protein [Trachymyrmex septentrionalis]|uniref:GDP-Man:Man(3)GlcNAc(2)-PP-Dol alpha-1,2-mannosyltransferase n=1 Tax=Trachymyrmex septentrionalis TaxID=34720 RepID=A0A195FW16_9HYME|nr:Asparagine-linked glycosylation protein 11 like protein [Trachymyrmex septentrionalis]